MNPKLRLDPDALQVETFVAQQAPAERGTVRANDGAATHDISCKTACFTTPCCAPTVTCP
jgi:hypothetical protein